MVRKTLSSNQKNRKSSKRGEGVKKRPRLPNSMRKELEIPSPWSDEGVNSDDFYEYEEAVPEEELKKNRRYDPVKDLRYKFSADKDEDIQSDEGEVEEEDEGRHARMLEGITGLPRDAFEEKKRKRNVVITEAYPEPEYNPSRSDGPLCIQDFLDPLHGKPGFSKLRKRVEKMEKKSKVTPAPLPKVVMEKVEREVAYEFWKNDITKWELPVKKNRGGDIHTHQIGYYAHQFLYTKIPFE